MAEQGRQCHHCENVCPDLVTSDNCPHRFCKTCLSEPGRLRVFNPEDFVDSRCTHCDRNYLHGRVDFGCPICKEPFRCYEHMPEEDFFLLLMLLQSALVILAVYYVTVCVLDGRSTKTYYFPIVSAFSLGYAAYCVYRGVSYYRLCCESRRNSTFSWVLALTVLGCYA